MKRMTGGEAVRLFCVRNAVPIVFLLVSAIGIYYSQFTAEYLIQEMLTRLARNAFLVLSLLIPIMAGMGLNFGMVLGAMAGQIGLIFISDWNVSGLYGMTLAALIATPLAILFGWMCGAVLNKARGREMVTSYILGFFMNGVYQLAVLYGFGSVVPISQSRTGAFARVRHPQRDQSGRHPQHSGTMPSRWTSWASIFLWPPSWSSGVFCLFIVWFRRTKLGQDMRATGQDLGVAHAAGIPSCVPASISIVISTVLAAYGQIIFLQNVGTLNTYNSHEAGGRVRHCLPAGGRGHSGPGIHSQRVHGRSAFPSDVRGFSHGGQVSGG